MLRSRRSSRTVRWRLLAPVPAAVVLVRKRRNLGLPPALSCATAYAVPVAVALALPRGRARAAFTWCTHMWAYKASFEMPYDRPERLRERLHIDAPIRVDAAIGRGTPPSQRLQTARRRPPELTLLDRLAVAVYVAWELEPHAALAWILWRHPERFPHSAVQLGATFDATLIGYWLFPAAPPWWASEREGRMDRTVRRVTSEVFKEWRGKPRPGTDHNTGANPWAAMPSDHFATAATAALVLAPVDIRLSAAAAAYALALALALVYTGEHYVTDIVAGGALAAMVEVAATAGERWSAMSRH